ncbi:MAG: c-type cytochrome [Rhodoferax sp.]|nr:c-type cytochrome [Rhodoferax sp.]
MIKQIVPLLLLTSCALPVLAQDIQGDPLAGSRKNALCIGCHGIKGFHTAFPETHKVPKLSGQSAGYLSAALHAYRSGERKHPSMRTMATSLKEQDIADLAAYYESTGTGAAVPETAHEGSPAAAALVAKAGCTSCHGANFSKPISPTYPKIAGQHADYLYVALKAYKTTDKPLIGRSQPIMGGIAAQFSNAELKVLADYVGSLPGELQTIQRARVK